MLEQNMIDKMVEAIEIEKGELVLLHFWGEDNERETLHMFEYAVASQGAMSISLHQARSVNVRLFHCMMEQVPEKYYSMFDKVDVVIDICMYSPVVPGENMTNEDKPKYGEYMRNLFGALSDKKKFVQVRIPTRTLAQEVNFDAKEFISRMEDAYNIDYKDLKVRCNNEVDKMKKKHQWTLRTGRDCSLSFDLSNRQWHVDAGDGDMPCGEIYIAPNEDKTNGTIYFEKLYWEGVHKDVILTIEQGSIISSNHSKVNELLDELPESGRIVSELGIGMNPNITDTCGYPVLDEKMNGTVHIGIGMNMMFGGKNLAPMHLDLVYKGEWNLE